jgi:hypothetical protein
VFNFDVLGGEFAEQPVIRAGNGVFTLKMNCPDERGVGGCVTNNLNRKICG